MTNWTDLAGSADGSLGRHPASRRLIRELARRPERQNEKVPSQGKGMQPYGCKGIQLRGPETPAETNPAATDGGIPPP